MYCYRSRSMRVRWCQSQGEGEEGQKRVCTALNSLATFQTCCTGRRDGEVRAARASVAVEVTGALSGGDRQESQLK